MARSNNNNGPTGLFDRLHSTAPSREDLQAAAQLAVQVEFTTIPTYLTALYSMSATDNFAYQALRSVAIEEMFHVNQAANLLVALGGQPRFTGEYAPQYPCYLPRANPDTTPFIGLCRASPEVFGSLFAAIETPAEHDAPPQGDNYDSIAQLYAALADGIKAYDGNPFEADPATGRQRTDIYLGKFGGEIIKITDKDSALRAINEIIQQGEGTVPATEPLVPLQQHGSYNHYGQRTDGTYGPIIGTPYELSHFIKFRKVALDPGNFPPTLPIVSNGRIEDYSNPDAADKARLFDMHYSVMLHALEQSFAPLEQGSVDAYFAVVLNLMHSVLPNLARALMNTPATLKGNNATGPNAAPVWSYRPGVGIQQLEAALRDVMKNVSEHATSSGDREAALAPLSIALEGLQTTTASMTRLDL